jgi:hypothetical protein
MSSLTIPASAANGAFRNVVIRTTSGAYAKPNGISRIRVTCVGGGGGGGDAPTPGAGLTTVGLGGGGGGLSISVIEAGNISASTNITIGAGGNNGQPGTSGGQTSFGSQCVANGGNGGSNTGAANGFVSGNAGGSVGTAVGDIKLAGSWSSFASFRTGSFVMGSMGGKSPLYGTGYITATDGTNSLSAQDMTSSLQYGAGGGGGICTNPAAQGNGGRGGPGICIIEEFY